MMRFQSADFSHLACLAFSHHFPSDLKMYNGTVQLYQRTNYNKLQIIKCTLDFNYHNIKTYFSRDRSKSTQIQKKCTDIFSKQL